MDRTGTVRGNPGTQKESDGLWFSQPPSQLRQFLCGSRSSESRGCFDSRRGFFHYRPVTHVGEDAQRAAIDAISGGISTSPELRIKQVLEYVNSLVTISPEVSHIVSLLSGK